MQRLSTTGETCNRLGRRSSWQRFTVEAMKDFLLWVGSVTPVGSVELPSTLWKSGNLQATTFRQAQVIFGEKSSRASLTVRFTVKNGDPPEHGKIWENRFFTGKMDHQGHETPQTYETTCHLCCGTCQNFFSFTFVTVGTTFLKVTLKLLRRRT